MNTLLLFSSHFFFFFKQAHHHTWFKWFFVKMIIKLMIVKWLIDWSFFFILLRVRARVHAKAPKSSGNNFLVYLLNVKWMRCIKWMKLQPNAKARSMFIWYFCFVLVLGFYFSRLSVLTLVSWPVLQFN